MTIIYIIWGVIFFSLGLYIAIPEVKAYLNGGKDEWGFKIGIFISGVTLAIMGLMMIFQNI
jgi:hypothetical protein